MSSDPASRVRDAMIADPRSLPATASARDAGEVLTPAEVRAVYVVGPDGELVGVVTRKTLVARVVAEGRDPSATQVGELAEAPYYTIDADTPLDDAFRFIEERDAERVPVVDEGRLVGVVTRKTLVARVVAEGRDPSATQVGPLAEAPYYTIDADTPLDDAFRFIEEQDAERVPVVDDGRLVGVISRAVLQRRLAEDEEPADADAAAGAEDP